MKKSNEKDGPMRGKGSAYDELQGMKRSFMRRNQVRAGRRRGRTHDLVILCMVCILHYTVYYTTRHTTLPCILHYTAHYTTRNTTLHWILHCIIHSNAYYTVYYTAYYTTLHNTVHITLHTPAWLVVGCIVSALLALYAV